MASASVGSVVEEIGILGRLLLTASEKMTPAMARFVTKFDFTSEDRDRMTDLARRNRLGELSPVELAELQAFAKTTILLGRLDLQARKALGRSPRKPVRSKPV